MNVNILPSFINGQDEDMNRLRMNSTFLDLMSNASFCDCQSMPLKTFYADLYQSARFSIAKNVEKYLRGSNTALYPNKKFMLLINQTPYADLLQERAEVPEGMSVTYNEYFDVLIPAQERANRVLDDVIKPFTKYCAKIVTDEAFRNGVRHSIKEFTDLEVTNEVMTKDIAKCFALNSYDSTASFSKVVQRNADWPVVFSNQAKLKSLYDKYDQKAVTKGLNELYEVIDKLVEVINVDGMAKTDEQVTKLLGAGIYSVAREIEFTAMVTYRTQVLIKSVNDTVQDLEKKKRL